MLRYIDSTPIFTCEAPSLTYSEHLTSQTLQATFFFELGRENHSAPRRPNPRCISPMDSQRVRDEKISSMSPGSHQGNPTLRAGCPWERYIEDKFLLLAAHRMGRLGAEWFSKREVLPGDLVMPYPRGEFSRPRCVDKRLPREPLLVPREHHAEHYI